MQPNDPRKDLAMGFDVYYDNGNTRPRKYFATRDEAVAWADKHADKGPEVYKQVFEYRPRANPQFVGKVETLDAFADVLAEWVKGAKENHEALDHRGEPAGEECWTRFYAGDITNMIDDAARRVGVFGWQPKGS
jgi:hypothetical protein